MADFIRRIPFTSDSTAGSIERMGIRELVALRPARWNIHVLRRMLRWAVALELSTIPLYLFARWSVAVLGNEVVDWMTAITRQEMAHMATALNILKGIGGASDLIRAAPRFPRRGLPGGVRPDLYLKLRPLSKRTVRKVFMEIEKPEFGLWQVHAGQTYPTIGAFYEAICERLQQSGLTALDTTHQLEHEDAEHGVVVKIAPDVDAAIKEIRRIVSEGEGTSSTPETEAGSGVLSHYWSFSQIAVGKTLVYDGQGWSYSGDAVDFPKPEEIRRIRPALPGECEESVAFDCMYTKILDSLQEAWQKGGKEGAAMLVTTFNDMGELFPLAYELMMLPPRGGRRLGPGFHIAY